MIFTGSAISSRYYKISYADRRRKGFGSEEEKQVTQLFITINIIIL